MMEEVIIAFLSGIFLSISPCHLPLYPVLFEIVRKNKKNAWVGVVSFCIGVAATYNVVYLCIVVLLRAFDAVLVEQSLEIFFKAAYFVAAVTCYLFAAQNMGYLSFFERTFKILPESVRGVGGSFTTGAFFAAAVSPCNLPYLLVTFVPIITNPHTYVEGVLALAAFSVAVSVPFLVLGIGSSTMFKRVLLSREGNFRLLSSLFLIVTGTYLLMNLF